MNEKIKIDFVKLSKQFEEAGYSIEPTTLEHLLLKVPILAEIDSLTFDYSEMTIKILKGYRSQFIIETNLIDPMAIRKIDIGELDHSNNNPLTIKMEILTDKEIIESLKKFLPVVESFEKKNTKY